jgi:hypothetical protein
MKKEPVTRRNHYVPIWDTNWDQSHDIDQGARRYVAHTRQKFAVGGKLHDRSQKDAPKQ